MKRRMSAPSSYVMDLMEVLETPDAIAEQSGVPLKVIKLLIDKKDANTNTQNFIAILSLWCRLGLYGEVISEE